MSARCSLVVNGKAVRVSTGDTPMEAALAEGMIGTMQALHGQVLLGQGGASAARRAQQGRSRRRDALKALAPSPVERPEILASAAPQRLPMAKRLGAISEVNALSPHVVEVVVTLSKRLALEPGQEVVMTAGGCEPVTLAPTLRLEATTELNELVFHLRSDAQAPQGTFTRALGNGLGHDLPVKVKGPVGRGFYRPGGGRLVLVSSETGFAAIWAIARAARCIEPAREIVLVVGARDPLDLYMRPALDWLRGAGVTRAVLVTDRRSQRPPDARPGPLTAHLPALRATDVVHVAGGGFTVGAVEALAAAVGARCYPIRTGDA